MLWRSLRASQRGYGLGGCCSEFRSKESWRLLSVVPRAVSPWREVWVAHLSKHHGWLLIAFEPHQSTLHTFLVSDFSRFSVSFSSEEKLKKGKLVGQNIAHVSSVGRRAATVNHPLPSPPLSPQLILNSHYSVLSPLVFITFLIMRSTLVFIIPLSLRRSYASRGQDCCICLATVTIRQERIKWDTGESLEFCTFCPHCVKTAGSSCWSVNCSCQNGDCSSYLLVSEFKEFKVPRRQL